MSDNDYKDLLQNYEETPPPSAWEAVEKGLHKPWFTQPVFIGTVVLAVSALTAWLVFSPVHVLKNAANEKSITEQTTSETSDTKPADDISTGNKTGNPEKAQDATSPQITSDTGNPSTYPGTQSTTTTSGESGNKPSGRNPDTQKPDNASAAGNNGYVTPGSNNTTRTLGIDAKNLCVNDILPIRVNIGDENCMLYTGDGYSVALPKGRFVFPYKYTKAGTYRISVKRQNEELIGLSFEVYNKSEARYRAYISEANLNAFENLSENAIAYRWLFGDGGDYLTEAKKTIEHAFTSASVRQYPVKLIAINRNGCSDTFEMTVTNARYRNYFNTPVPNVFTPNGDGINDVFEIPAADLKEWQLIIVDERGNKVFETAHQYEFWNGKMFNNGTECSPGNYRYYITYRQPDDTETHQKSGYISLIR